MNEEIFITKNREYWQKLAGYNRRLTNGSAARLSVSELREFAELIRAAGHHLAYARTHFGGGETAEYLNRLVGISHNRFYTREKMRLSRALGYLSTDFSRMVRSESRFFLLSAAAFFIGAVSVFFLCAAEPSMIGHFLPDGYAGTGAPVDSWIYPVLSSAVVTNNIRVAFLAFAFGFLAGVGTLYILLVNGGVIGAYVYAAMSGGTDMAVFWSLILPHGVIELTAIFISGAAGLIIGRAVLIPGRYRRRDALIIASKRAATFIPGTALMLVLAGLTEGFFTPLDIAYVWKFIFAALTAIFIACYFIFSARSRSRYSG